MRLFEAAAVLRVTEERLGRELRADEVLPPPNRRHPSAERTASGRWRFNAALLLEELPPDDHVGRSWVTHWERGEIAFVRPARRWEQPTPPRLREVEEAANRAVPERSSRPFW